MSMQALTGTDTAFAARLLREGELVAIPTETVYGLAGNALDPEAVVKIFSTKNRPHFNPLIVHVADMAQAQAFVTEWPEIATRLAARFWPGPMTLLLPRRESIPDLVTAGSPLVALRVPAHPLTLALLRQLDFPLAAPSANPFGYISPTTPAHVAAQLGDRIRYILDGGPCTVGIESTIIGFDAAGKALIYRPGGLAAEAIEALAGPLSYHKGQSARPDAPGMLASHYAPATPLRLGPIDELIQAEIPARTGILAWSRRRPEWPFMQEILSPSGNAEEAARTLFASLRRLDEAGLDLILAEPAPEEGLGRAINDRLRRAAAERAQRNL